MSTTVVSSSDDLIPLAPPREDPVRKFQQQNTQASAWLAIHTRVVQLGSMLRSCLPTVISPRQAMTSLADGYDRLTRQCLQPGDSMMARHYRMSAKTIRGQTECR